MNRIVAVKRWLKKFELLVYWYSSKDRETFRFSSNSVTVSRHTESRIFIGFRRVTGLPYRDRTCVPDVSLAACTSFATPIFAAIQAEIDQRQGTRKGPEHCQEWSKYANIIALDRPSILIIGLTACGGGNQPTVHISIPGGAALSWAGSWMQGVRKPPITFQAIGQAATVTASASVYTTQPPYPVSVAGNCVTSGATTMNTTVQITAANSGTCTIWIGTSAIQATVP